MSDLASLLRNASLTDPAELLDAANTSLKKNPHDLHALQVKVVSLVKLDQFDDTLRVFESAGAKLKEAAPLELAYALYKVGELDDAIKVVNEGPASRALRHVEAQAKYKAEYFEDAAQIYGDLAKTAGAGQGEENDLRINSRAVDAQLEWSRRGDLVMRKKPGREDLEAFETAYNAACGCIARAELGQGEILLKRAKALCEALEDLSEAEKQAEMLPILVQQVYVLARQGKIEEATKLSQGLDITAYYFPARLSVEKTNNHPVSQHLPRNLSPRLT
jgi:signal recognition particle subunit SRP72